MLATLFTALSLTAGAEVQDAFMFKDGDRVVLLGSTLIEREQQYGHWELALTLKNHGKNVTFRNLGWSGDTVWCESRGSFGGQPEGFKKTIELVKELKPTVIVLCYGHVESFDGEAGVPKFKEGLWKLIDALSETKARIVLMTPTPFQNSDTVKDGFAKNTRLAEYANATAAVAEDKQLEFFDLFKQLTASDQDYSYNGTHLDEAGYETTAGWMAGMSEVPEAEDLRKAIVAKNELFFHRWRPQNQTYLFGFRKHEQGQNAKEVAEFDPLVEEQEKRIAQLLAALKQAKPPGRGAPQ
jgi:lysophospholipase L1-like esterase